MESWGNEWLTRPLSWSVITNNVTNHETILHVALLFPFPPTLRPAPWLMLLKLHRKFRSMLPYLLTRKLHCTRNYIHMNLFVSFILRAAAVISKEIIFHLMYSNLPKDDPGWNSYSSSAVLSALPCFSCISRFNFNNFCLIRPKRTASAWSFPSTDGATVQVLQSEHGVLCGV